MNLDFIRHIDFIKRIDFIRREVKVRYLATKYIFTKLLLYSVQILPYDGTMRTTPKKAHEGQARAKFNFIAQTNLELSLAKGQTIVARRISLNLTRGNERNVNYFSKYLSICLQANWWS